MAHSLLHQHSYWLRNFREQISKVWPPPHPALPHPAPPPTVPMPRVGAPPCTHTRPHPCTHMHTQSTHMHTQHTHAQAHARLYPARAYACSPSPHRHTHTFAQHVRSRMHTHVPQEVCRRFLLRRGSHGQPNPPPTPPTHLSFGFKGSYTHAPPSPCHHTRSFSCITCMRPHA